MLHTGLLRIRTISLYQDPAALLRYAWNALKFSRSNDRDEHITYWFTERGTAVVLEARPQGSPGTGSRSVHAGSDGVGERSHLLSRAINLDTHIDDIVT